MNRDDGGGGGPFSYYPVTGGAIRDTADEVDTSAGDIRVVRRQVEAAHRRALDGVDGDLSEPMAEAPAATIANADRVEQAAYFAAGVVRLFADAVDDYNHYATGPRSVEALNAAYTEARLDDFGLDADAYAKGGTKAERDYAAEWEAADASLLRSLTAECHRLGDWLDARAEQVARMLDRGPNPGDVTALWAAGALPPDATEIWPGLDLVEVPLLRLPYELRDDPGDRRTLDQLSQDELMELWEEYGFEPARELVGDRIVHDFENMTALREFNLSINLAYMSAMAQGMPEWFARRLARIHPETLFDLLAPVATSGEVTYDVTIGGLVDALRDDPWSLRTLGELAMVLPIGKVGKIRRLDELIHELDNASDARHFDEALEWQDVSGILRDASRGKGNFGLGSGTRTEADAAGLAWVGDDYRLSRDGKALISSDGLRQYRLPTYKPRRGEWQANFEERPTPRGEWQSNGHLEIVGQ